MIDERIRKLIEQDRQTCRERIEAITPDTNFEVLERNYLLPETGKVRVTTSRDGLLCY